MDTNNGGVADSVWSQQLGQDVHHLSFLERGDDLLQLLFFDAGDFQKLFGVCNQNVDRLIAKHLIDTLSCFPANTGQHTGAEVGDDLLLGFPHIVGAAGNPELNLILPFLVVLPVPREEDTDTGLGGEEITQGGEDIAPLVYTPVPSKINRDLYMESIPPVGDAFTDDEISVNVDDITCGNQEVLYFVGG